MASLYFVRRIIIDSKLPTASRNVMVRHVILATEIFAHRSRSETLPQGTRLWDFASLRMVMTMSDHTIEDALIAILKQHGAIDAAQLLKELEAKNFTLDEVRAALSRALSKGKLQLGRDLRFELEHA